MRNHIGEPCCFSFCIEAKLLTVAIAAEPLTSKYLGLFGLRDHFLFSFLVFSSNKLQNCLLVFDLFSVFNGLTDEAYWIRSL